MFYLFKKKLASKAHVKQHLFCEPNRLDLKSLADYVEDLLDLIVEAITDLESKSCSQIRIPNLGKVDFLKNLIKDLSIINEVCLFP